MKTNKIFMLGILALGLAGCAMEGRERAAMKVRQEGDTVRVSTTITSVDSRLAYEEGTGNTTFTAGDQIRVKNTLGASGNEALYTLNGSSWETTDSFVWNDSTDNQFEAWYPATGGTSFDTFSLPADQSTEELLAAADWMTASTDAIARPADGTLKLDFHHRLAKVTVNITEWNDEFGGEAQTVSNPKIYTKGTGIEVSYGTGADGADEYTSNGGLTAIRPYATGQTYTAIVAPVRYDANNNFMTFTVNDQEMTVLVKSETFTNGLESGKHYTFNLKVGKDKVTLTPTTTDTDFPGGWNNDSEVDLK